MTRLFSGIIINTTITDEIFIFKCHFCACSMLMDFISLCLQGFKQQALAVSTDPEHRFELALQLGELKIAYQLAVEAEVRAYVLYSISHLSPSLKHCHCLTTCLIFAILSPAVGAEVEAASRAGYQ